MASKKTLNTDNLEALGAPRLAQLLMEISEGNATARRRLRLELAANESPAELAKEIRKRLATIARSRTFVDWQSRKSLIDDLEAQRSAIADQVGKRMPAEGLDLMWRFLDLANPVLGRCDDSNGTISGVFQAAVGELGMLAQSTAADRKQLADRMFNSLTRNEYGQFDGLIPALQAALGPAGLEHLKQRMIALSVEPVKKPPAKERKPIGWGSNGPFYTDEIAEHSRASTVRLALLEIADAQGDVNAFIARYDEQVRKVPKVAAGITRRLLAAGRGEEAQAARWSCFERSLSTRHLREHQKRLPDFDDVEAEEP
jgi:hypothetical protein